MISFRIRYFATMIFLTLLAPFVRVFLVVGYPPLRALRLVARSIGALVSLPLVILDERVTSINLMRTQINVLAAQANYDVARIGEILMKNGVGSQRDEGREFFESVIRVMKPKKTMEIPFPPMKDGKSSIDLRAGNVAPFPDRKN